MTSKKSGNPGLQLCDKKASGGLVLK